MPAMAIHHERRRAPTNISGNIDGFTAMARAGHPKRNPAATANRTQMSVLPQMTATGSVGQQRRPRMIGQDQRAGFIETMTATVPAIGIAHHKTEGRYVNGTKR